MASFLLFWVAGAIFLLWWSSLQVSVHVAVSDHGSWVTEPAPGAPHAPPWFGLSVLEEAEKIGRLLASWAVALPGG